MEIEWTGRNGHSGDTREAMLGGQETKAWGYTGGCDVVYSGRRPREMEAKYWYYGDESDIYLPLRRTVSMFQG
jgi:hypothetical protein